MAGTHRAPTVDVPTSCSRWLDLLDLATVGRTATLIGNDGELTHHIPAELSSPATQHAPIAVNLR